MTAPVIPLGTESLVTVPYVQVNSFKASPTFLDLQNLVSASSSAADQDAELYNQLLKSSSWTCNQLNMPVHACTTMENVRLTVARDGAMRWHASRKPVKYVGAVTYGYAPGVANQRAIIDLSGVWVEDDVQITLPFGPMSSAFNAIQFGPPAASSTLYTVWTYTAGYVNTILAGTANSGALSITVADPTGIVAGDVLRIWDPGKEEALMVANSYVPGSTFIPLTAGLVNTHTVAGSAPGQRIGVSQITMDVQLAVTYHAMAMLVRPDTAAEDTWPDGARSSTQRDSSARTTGGNLVKAACDILSSYTRVR